MSNLKITTNWVNSDEKDVLFAQTASNLQIDVNSIPLTKNVNIWTRKVEDHIVVSTYPLAEWFAYYWWRLENELMPGSHTEITWRFAHEIGSANHGFVWPKVAFASDGEAMNIYSKVIGLPGQSVEYIGERDDVQTLPLTDFQKEVSAFISSTIERLGELPSELKEMWHIVQEEISDPEKCIVRKIEAALGFDPEECPEDLLNKVFALQKQVGNSSTKEVAPFLREESFRDGLLGVKGFSSSLSILSDEIQIDKTKNLLPWQEGVEIARQIRKKLHLGERPLVDSCLRDLLGISKKDFDAYGAMKDSLPVSVGKNAKGSSLEIIPRAKPRNTGRRFELARLLGDALINDSRKDEWLISSDYRSARQKRQRAFAAELLCPINALEGYLNGDYSETKQEAAADHFYVSDYTVKTLLVNYGRIERESFMPYAI